MNILPEYLFYNTLLIGLYEKLMMKKDEHFNCIDKDVLYQINKLNKKYPNTIQLNDIIDIDPNRKVIRGGYHDIDDIKAMFDNLDIAHNSLTIDTLLLYDTVLTHVNS